MGKEFAHAELFKRDWTIIEEATGTSYTERNRLSFPFYTDRIIIVRTLEKREIKMDIKAIIVTGVTSRSTQPNPK